MLKWVSWLLAIIIVSCMLASHVLGSLEIPMDDGLRAEISALSPAPPPATDRSEERTDTHFFIRT